MCGSRLAFGFLTEVTGEMVQMAENRLDIEVRSMCWSCDATSMRSESKSVLMGVERRKGSLFCELFNLKS